MRALALAMALFAGACAGPEAGSEPLGVGSLALFEAEVQPHIEQRCAQGTCHGRPEQPLSLYARGFHRLDPTRRFLDEPITDEELLLNARGMSAFAHGVTPRSSLLLCKPLALAVGGCWHGGGELFADWYDPAHQAIEEWLATRATLDGGSP